jgi:hypothetical protein
LGDLLCFGVNEGAPGLLVPLRVVLDLGPLLFGKTSIDKGVVAGDRVQEFAVLVRDDRDYGSRGDCVPVGQRGQAFVQDSGDVTGAGRAFEGPLRDHIVQDGLHRLTGQFTSPEGGEQGATSGGVEHAVDLVGGQKAAAENGFPPEQISVGGEGVSDGDERDERGCFPLALLDRLGGG